MYSITIEEARNYIDLRTELLLDRFLTFMRASDRDIVNRFQLQAFLYSLPHTPGAGKKTEECAKRLLLHLEE